SDTVQNAADFVFDGSPGVAGGYNTNGNINRADNVFATGDANGRAVYDGTCGAVTNTATGIAPFCDSTTNQSPNLLPGSVILRAGTAPVVRPNGSGAGVAALIPDSAAPGYKNLPTGSIQFARMSRLPNATEEGNCPTTTASCAGLHVFQVATDNLTIARTTAGYNGPAGLSAAGLVSIYSCSVTKWNALTGNSSGSSDTIHPLIPQSGSGTRNFFLADLQAANGGNPVTLGSCVRTVEEHDPTGIYGDPTPGDAIEPFSTGKLALINSGYFANGAGYSGTSFAQGAYTPNFLSTLTGTAPDGSASYTSTRGLYFTVRQADVIGTTPFQPGSTQTWVSALITSGASAIRSASGKAEIQAAGFTAAYKDCGINPTAC
ncbi:MAG: substrate-binding domain-containing protein, partial [Actinobacteria bacterium]|nr:substrate-binding domain-containing protein [Actinomycetota bacterium]